MESFNVRREESPMRRLATISIAASAAAVLPIAAASGPAAVVSIAAASSAPSCPKPPSLPGQFVGQVNNPYLPLTPGTTLTYKGKLDGESATDVISVTNQTKVIQGVAVSVVHDQVIVKGDLVEDTFDWFAQDSTGNVWYFGEDTKELDHGRVTTTQGSWEAGVDHARAGIFMPATPTVGQVFKQEDAKNVAEDCTKIVDLGADIKTPYVTSNEALKTEEFSLLEPGVLDNKFYVPGIGLVREQTVQGGSDVLELVSVKTA